MTTINDSVSVTVADDEENIHTLLVDYSVEAVVSYDPGRVSGPPEHCYPPEGECEIVRITIQSVSVDGEAGDPTSLETISAAFLTRIVEALDTERMEEKLYEAFSTEQEDYYDEDAAMDKEFFHGR